MSIWDIITNKQEYKKRINFSVYLLNVKKQLQQQQQHFGKARVPPTLPSYLFIPSYT